MRAARDQAGEVRHVDKEVGVDGPGDRGHPLEVERARIGAVAGEQHLRPDLFCLAFEGVVVDPLGRGVDAVGNEVIELA